MEIEQLTNKLILTVHTIQQRKTQQTGLHFHGLDTAYCSPNYFCHWSYWTFQAWAYNICVYKPRSEIKTNVMTIQK